MQPEYTLEKSFMPAEQDGQRLSWVVKRGMDFALAAVGLVILAPLFLVVAILIKLDSPGPVIFKQKRVGRGGRLFTFYKFRSMSDGGDDASHREYIRRLLQDRSLTPGDNGREKVFKLADDPRITGVGRLIRKTSIDELPQLFNVLRGEMSLVGPRPPIPYEVEMYTKWQKRRLAVTPGITGLWQVSGRNRLGYRECIKLDIEYIKKWCLRLDIKILLKTIPAVMARRGAL